MIPVLAGAVALILTARALCEAILLRREMLQDDAALRAARAARRRGDA